MSRGPGKTQRFVLERLQELRAQGDRGYHNAYALAAAMTGSADPSPSAVQSVRQAIRRLDARGLVETARIQSYREGLPLRWEPMSVQRRERLREEHVAQLSDSERERLRHGDIVQLPGGPIIRRRRVYVRQPDRVMLHARLPLTVEENARAEAEGANVLAALIDLSVPGRASSL